MLTLLKCSETQNPAENVALKKRKSIRDVDFLAPFKILLEKDIFCLMAYGGILCVSEEQSGISCIC